MTEIQRLLSETIDDLNVREKRDNRPRFSISFIRKHLGYLSRCMQLVCDAGGHAAIRNAGGVSMAVSGVIYRI